MFEPAVVQEAIVAQAFRFTVWLELAVSPIKLVLPIVIERNDVNGCFNRSAVEPSATSNDPKCHAGLTPELSRAEGVGLNELLGDISSPGSREGQLRPMPWSHGTLPPR